MISFLIQDICFFFRVLSNPILIYFKQGMHHIAHQRLICKNIQRYRVSGMSDRRNMNIT
jgi:hypothetical protein